MRIFIFSIFLFLIPLKILAQDCEINLSGVVQEISTEHHMENVYVTIVETNQKVATNEKGEFSFTNLCPGDYHVLATHIGCEDCTVFCKVENDKTLNIKLKHFSELLNETIIHVGDVKSLQETNTLDEQLIKKQSNKSLGDILSTVQGVSSVKVGGGISKPIINGLVGNRVGFIDNGVPLASQQWGIDHAPEIDPTKADHISVLKGVAALEYATTANAIVIVEPYRIKKEPHLHGDFNYIYDTNSRGHTANLALTNYNKIVGFHLTGTLKKAGDAKAPDYFLTNTGVEQQNFSALLDKEIGSNLVVRANYSYFKTTLGILTGALNETRVDVERSLMRDVPLRTNDSFSYDIEKPNQDVTHHFAKFEADYKFSNISNLKLEYAYQLNKRAEFDRRRGVERSERPELELEIDEQYLSSVFKTKFTDSDSFKAGIQYKQTKNRNIFGTGTWPLVPDYNSDEAGFFSTYTNHKEKWGYEFGGRLSLSSFNVATAIGEIIRFRYDYTNFSVAAGVSYEFHHDLTSEINIGYTTRGAKTNELFSFGLHQGVAAFEQGSFFGDEKKLLDDEKNLKITWSWDYHKGEKFFIQTLFYANPINNFIYLSADQDIVITIRGANSTFTYRQADALLFGQDFNLVYNPIEQLRFNLKYAYLYGQNLSLDAPLIFMPPNNGSLATTYTFKNGKKLNNTSVSLSVNHTAEQNRFNIDEELIAPPDEAYTLLNFSAATEIEVGKQKIDVGFNIENLTNKSYRNYLNRLRYFADEQGINLSFRLAYQF